MLTTRKTLMAALSGAALMVAGPALAATTVHVELGGDMTDAAMPTGLGHGMHGDMAKASMWIKIDKKTVHAGRIVFDVTNDAKDMIHEMIVAPLKSKDEILPYNKDENRVDEEKAGHLGEVSELDPSKSGTLGLDLKPGEYLLYCNIPGHYMDGMWTTLMVTK